MNQKYYTRLASRAHQTAQEHRANQEWQVGLNGILLVTQEGQTLQRGTHVTRVPQICQSCRNLKLKCATECEIDHEKRLETERGEGERIKRWKITNRHVRLIIRHVLNKLNFQ